MDELKFLVKKGWVPYTLRDWWDYYQIIGIRNINCTYLRQIGKTATIRSLIQEYYERALKLGGDSIQNLPIILVKNEQYGSLYKDLYGRDKLRYIVTARKLRHGRYRGYTNPILSDEVPDAVQIVKEAGFDQYYVGGFYSED